MKKIFLSVLIINSLWLNGQSDSSQLLDDFVNSEDYSRFITTSQFSSNGQINLLTSNVSYHEHPSLESKTVPVLNINFTSYLNDETRLVGQIQAIKVREDYNSLPFNSRYLMLYRDFRQFDHNTKTGTIKIHDLNYDEYLVATADLTNGELGFWDTYPMPPITIERHGLDPYRIHPCDQNQNGNVTFGECFRCMIIACMSNLECATLCGVANFFGNRCNRAISISCLWLAIRF